MFDTTIPHQGILQFMDGTAHFETFPPETGIWWTTEYIEKYPDSIGEWGELRNLLNEQTISEELKREVSARINVIDWNSRYERKQDEFIPIVSLSNLPNFKNPKVDVYNVLFHNIPIPHPETPVEHILEYKNNNDNEGRLLQFRALINKLSKSGYTELEIQQEINHLMNSYKQSMAKHKIKSLTGVLDVALSIALLPVFAASKILEKVIKLRSNQVNLASIELASPGREISYIYKAKQMFAPE